MQTLFLQPIFNCDICSIIETFINGSKKAKTCCQTCGISLSYSHHPRCDFYKRGFCSKYCHDEKKEEDSEKKNMRTRYSTHILRDDPFYGNYIKFIIATDIERYHLNMLEDREQSKYHNILDQWHTHIDPYYWLKRPLSQGILLWDFILDEVTDDDDGVYEYISDMFT